MKIQIKHRTTDVVLYELEAESLADAVARIVANRTNLRGANLEGANLEGAYLMGTNLRGANLEGAYLEGANLMGANLEGAYLEGANLRGANLEGAYLEGANLRGTNLMGANLRGANLEGAYLEGTNLMGANLEGAKGLLSKPINPLQIFGSRDSIIVRQDGYITIGCVHQTVVWWESPEGRVAAATKYNYTSEQIEEYLDHVAACRRWMERYNVIDVIAGAA